MRGKIKPGVTYGMCCFTHGQPLPFFEPVVFSSSLHLRKKGLQREREAGREGGGGKTCEAVGTIDRVRIQGNAISEKRSREENKQANS